MSGSFPLTPTSTGGGSYARTYGEDHTGIVVASVIQLVNTYVAGTTCIFFNGVRLRLGISNDYIESSPATGRITLLGVYSAPGPTDIIIVDYDRA